MKVDGGLSTKPFFLVSGGDVSSPSALCSVPSKSVDSAPPSDALKLNCKDGVCQLVASNGYCIVRIEGERGSRTLLSKSAYLPPGKYRVYVAKGDVLYGQPAEVEVPKQKVGELKAVVGFKQYRVLLYNDGSWEEEESEISLSDALNSRAVECNGCEVVELTAVAFGGYILTTPYKPSRPDMVAKQLEVRVRWKVPKVAEGESLGEGYAEQTFSFKYTEKPELKLGYSIEVMPADCAFTGACRLALELCSPEGECAQLSVPISSSTSISLLQLYRSNLKSIGKGKLYRVRGKLTDGKKVYAEDEWYAEPPADLVQNPEKYGLSIGETVSSLFFPLRREEEWRFLWYSKSESNPCQECPLSLTTVPEELKGLVEEERVAVYAMFRSGDMKLAERTAYPLADSSAVLTDSDGQKLKADELKGEVPLWAVYTGKLKVDADSWALVETELMKVLVSSLHKSPTLLKLGEEQIPVIPSGEWLELLDAEGGRPLKLKVRLPLGEGGKEREYEATAVSPIKQVRAELKADGLKLKACCLSSGFVTVVLNGVLESGERKEVKQTLQVGGTKTEWEAEVPMSLPFASFDVRLKYELETAYNALFEVGVFRPEAEAEVECAKAEGSTFIADLNCVLSRAEVKVVPEPPVWYAVVSLPEGLPEWLSVSVNGKVLKPGDSISVRAECSNSHAELKLKAGQTERVLKVEAPRPQVKLSEEGVEVVQFGCEKSVLVVAEAVDCYTNECGVTADFVLTPEKPVLKLSEAVQKLAEMGAVPKVLVLRSGSNAEAYRLKVNVKGSWEAETIAVEYAGFKGDIVIECADGSRYRYPDEVQKVDKCCGVYAVFKLGKSEFRYYIGTPKLVLVLNEWSRTAEVYSHPMYFKKWLVRVGAVREDLSRADIFVKELGEQSVQVSYPADSLYVVAEAYVRRKLVAVDKQVLYGKFDMRVLEQNGPVVLLRIIGSFPQTSLVVLTAIGADGGQYLLWKDSWAGLQIVELEADLAKLPEEIVKLCASAGDRQVCADVAPYSKQTRKGFLSLLQNLVVRRD